MNMENRNYRNRAERTRRIELGDRIFARLTMGGRTVVEFMINRVADMTELLGELRQMTRGARGLARLYVRNQSRGWSLERPLMLYAPSVPDVRFGMFTERGADVAPSPRRMLFPWETH